ncbi:hypothetical protein [Thalassobellus citreus]|uniref:hypothetical protein n=1 Tax=Thalassobellus citreus TaxID=3367752 RepID=UPI0037A86270
MHFENSKYSKEFKYTKLEYPFGNFYLCEKFFISELNDGVHFNWEKIQLVMDDLIKHYDHDTSLAYISNRINSYSIDPQTWKQTLDKYKIIIASSIVAYTSFTFYNASLEKVFSEKSIKRCLNLKEAIEWSLNLREFNY